MWSKILTVVNTVLIFSIVGGGLFVYQENSINNQRLKTELSSANEAIESLIAFQNELNENPILNLGLDQGDTLRLTENGLVGFVDLEAFLSFEEKLVPTLEEPVQVAVLGLKNPTVVAFAEFINRQIELEAEFIKLEDGVMYLPLGCPVNNKIEATNLIVEEDVLNSLSTDSEDTSRIRLFFSNGSSFVDSCDSGVSGIQILN